MAKQVKLNAKVRTVAGKGKVKQLRDQGITPGIVYGAHTKPFSITVNARELGEVLHHATGENVLVDLAVDENGKTSNRLALIQEVQHHPFADTILHVDLHEVLATEKLRTKVPVRPLGEPAGVKTGGGVLEFILRELHVECLPKDLPDVVEVNVEKLEIGQSIHVGEIVPPTGVTFLDDKGQPVFLVVAPITEEEATPAAGAPGEPEVIGAKKEEGEAAAEGEAKPAAGKTEAGKAEAKPAAGAKAESKPAAGKAEAKPAAKK
ncbi:MAG: 50S ribosomal protein L25 [Verrucomicrobiae bacterium]|nr:50S ribosomal protein L25 [Verrucomicrobiae bacterium]